MTGGYREGGGRAIQINCPGPPPFSVSENQPVVFLSKARERARIRLTTHRKRNKERINNETNQELSQRRVRHGDAGIRGHRRSHSCRGGPGLRQRLGYYIVEPDDRFV